MDIRNQRYVLKAHRDLPPAEQVGWWYQRMTFGDMIDAQTAAKDLGDLQTTAWMVAHQLRQVDGLRRDGKPDLFPASAPIDVQVAWVLRLYPDWVTELCEQVGKDSDLDPEEE